MATDRSTDIPRLPARPADGHKGTFGSVAIVGGCATSESRMIGAPALAAASALRSGCGLARVYCPGPVLDAVLTITPAATGRAVATGSNGSVEAHEACAAVDEAVRWCTCLAIGPGMGRGAGTRAAALRAVQQQDVPAVVDADAINELAEVPQLTRDLRGAVVLTPHPGEFKRLCQGMGITDELGLGSSRERAAQGMAQRLGCIVVLKGQGTVVSDGARVWTNSSGHPCLATAGSGDVLTGLIAGLVAQFVAPIPAGAMPEAVTARLPRPAGRPLDLYDAARIGVHVHGLAGARWATRTGASGGMMAGDLAGILPEIIEGLRG